MRVIKLVNSVDGELSSIWAAGKWRKIYELGVATRPDVGYLFAFHEGDLAKAKKESASSQAWLADAEVVGSIKPEKIDMYCSEWQRFWKGIIPVKKKSQKYLLCKSITLIRRVDEGNQSITPTT